MNRTTGLAQAERQRLAAQRAGRENWRLWGPYLSERAWGTVREDYSPYGTAWEDFDHDQARSRAYRWSEDGLGGLCDQQQRLCFALALWNGRDPILKERAFGLTGNQGNRGEDVKEFYFYLDATPSHSWLRYLYKYPQEAYPYARLVEESRHRSRLDPSFGLLDSGVFEAGYWDVEVTYAKASPTEIHIRIEARNCGPARAVLHLLPTLWFRNTWTWGDGAERPVLQAAPATRGTAWAVQAQHASLGSYWLYGRRSAEPLFTENDSNAERLWGRPSPLRYVKDAFHRRVIAGEAAAVNPNQSGTKFAAWSVIEVAAGRAGHIDLVLSARPLIKPFCSSEAVFQTRREEADAFYHGLLPARRRDEMLILRQALAGMVWCKQFYHYEVERWLDGDGFPPPASRKWGRNAAWKHIRACDVISMPDSWEYPWFAAWDLAFHCMAFALIDIGFAKDQIELLLSERYLHPNGQIPAYEWAFGDVNPPMHALGALEVFRAERAQRGTADLHFLRRVFHKLLLNYTWWINRKDSEGHNVFEGGFLGLDNISVIDRSRPLPGGFRLKQSDATGWMAMFALNMTVMALEIAVDDPDYENIAIQCYYQFLAIANAIRGHASHGTSLWDPSAGFFKDLIVAPDGTAHRIDVYSLVGLIPLFATEVIEPRLLENVPRFRTMLSAHAGGLFRGNLICACPEHENDKGEHLLALIDESMLPQILQHIFDESEFLSPYGVGSVSRVHAKHRDLGVLPGIGEAMIEYAPGESTLGLFGGNSNWRGPIWIPINYLLVEALGKFHRYLGDGLTMSAFDGTVQTLKDMELHLTRRLIDLFQPDPDGRRPIFRTQGIFSTDPHWRDLLLFHEYFHADTGQGLGAAHQTGWTGLLANLVLRQYGRDSAPFQREPTNAATAMRRYDHPA
ncbi:MGH1-like glycoside hydrolase domain-containing protein [Microvirga yunnanensis]|uniref:MGH1-like glycoside hydrolase domain-containing protein n=1 Tax=Microvirga yunnanensis TaxID=2953740 RepID=UPI0021C68654|nr:glucosidase [Microvirga sp. HBU65207]